MSLIDVMMLLMIIFMLTAPMMQGGVDVALPRATARPLTTRSGVTVTLTRDGRTYVDDSPVAADRLASTLSARADARQGGVFLRADSGVAYGAVVRVLAGLRAAGLDNVGLVATTDAGS
ncbi:MAG: biopolymer transporter ExbD [Candidatus Eremiobacteraeota bacterium]|nr:biopolymer transporter ExbD [Candidatus Eremiobacteraeota bacterium]